MTPQKQIPPPPRMTAVVLSSGDYEATISRGRIAVSTIGTRGGRKPLFELEEPEASRLLDLIAAGRQTLERMVDVPSSP